MTRVDAREPESVVTIDTVTVGRRMVLGVTGEVDMSTVQQLRTAIDEALEAAPAELWIDFTDTVFMDSTGLHVVLDANERLLARNGGLSIISPEGNVRRLLEITGAQAALRIYPDRDAAHRAG
jgi:anti-sigma B factor antagonist